MMGMLITHMPIFPEDVLGILTAQKTMTEVFLLKFLSDQITIDILKAINELPELKSLGLIDYEIYEDGLPFLQQIVEKPLDYFELNNLYICSRENPYDAEIDDSFTLNRVNTKILNLCDVDLSVENILEIVNNYPIQVLILTDYPYETSEIQKACTKKGIVYDTNISPHDWY